MTKYEELITKSNEEMKADIAAVKSVVAHSECNSKAAYLDRAIAINKQNYEEAVVAETFNVDRLLELQARGAELQAQRERVKELANDLFS